MIEPSEPKTFRQRMDPELEKRSERAKQTLRLLQNLQADKQFDTEEHRQEFLDRISYDGLKRIGILTNDILRGKRKSRDFDGGDVQVRQLHAMSGVNVAEHIPPNPEDKEELLQEV